MITGLVTGAREPVVILRLLGADGQLKDIAVLVDTGFSEYLALTKRDIEELSLVLVEMDRVQLSDGSTIESEVYLGRVLWDGQERLIPIHLTEGDAVLGMALLHDHSLWLEAVYQGRVEIKPLLEEPAT